jgi:hypothetical protein
MTPGKGHFGFPDVKEHVKCWLLCKAHIAGHILRSTRTATCGNESKVRTNKASMVLNTSMGYICRTLLSVGGIVKAGLELDQDGNSR